MEEGGRKGDLGFALTEIGGLFPPQIPVLERLPPFLKGGFIDES